MTFSSNPIFGTILTLGIVTYLAAFMYLTTYLRRVYTMTWQNLGGFILWDERRRQLDHVFGWYVAGLRTLGFVLFSTQYSAVQDRKLTSLIWLVRTSFALCLVLMLVLMASNLIQQRQ
jgi:hypothetical protein